MPGATAVDTTEGSALDGVSSFRSSVRGDASY